LSSPAHRKRGRQAAQFFCHLKKIGSIVYKGPDNGKRSFAKNPGSQNIPGNDGHRHRFAAGTDWRMWACSYRVDLL
jgi:hypothetical protein